MNDSIIRKPAWARTPMPACAALACFALACLTTASATAADVQARLSTREAVVGVPIVLQVSIINAQDYEPPTLPVVDGCDIRSAGPPAQRSQIAIINGRRRESRSDTLSYRITPRREGSFEIPAFNIQVDGQSLSTRAMWFVATKSETDDLLFVEIDGDKDQVYVGQPLKLTLRIWLKPFRDAQRRLTLSEGDMWQMISPDSSWGSFSEPMQELAELRRRPGGQEVLRTDSEGNERSYYLYEVDGTIYPTHAGSIDADDVQIIVDYPTALGPSRSSLGSLFDDDFFGSAFGNRLAVIASRPLVGEVHMDSTQVLPVPTVGRPQDYRGAVGQYEIVAQANPTTVDAGEPITLNIGIAGTGPMELVQAPPLHELPELTADFKVADESLAGFVKQGTKLFSTTIRPRREGITSIPPIRFSYFDPDAEQFKTIHSEPISITVHAAESLAMDSIVGRSRSDQDSDDATASPVAPPQADFTNHHDPATVLVSQTAPQPTSWWWLLVVLPALVWLTAVVTKHHATILHWLPRVRSAQAKCLAALQRSEDGPAIVAALRQYIADRSRQVCPTPAPACGVLRTRGMSRLAADVESLMQKLDRDAAVETLLHGSVDQQAATDEAIALVDQLESAFVAQRRIRLRNPQRSPDRSSPHLPAQRSLGILVAATLALSTNTVLAADAVSLSPQQRQTVLAEAAQLYSAAMTAGATDSADAKAGFDAAAAKYQLLVDSGVHNSLLYRNLGNAYLQSGQLGRAIAYYELAKQLAPQDPTIRNHLRLANARIQHTLKEPMAEEADVVERLWSSLRAGNETILRWLGRAWLITALGIASLLFWGLLTIRTLGRRIAVWRWAALPFAMGTLCIGSLWLDQTAPPPPWNAVIVADHVNVYAGDGEAFDQLRTLDQSQGQRVTVVHQRGKWLQIRTADQQQGWIPDRDVLRVHRSGRW